MSERLSGITLRNAEPYTPYQVALSENYVNVEDGLGSAYEMWDEGTLPFMEPAWYNESMIDLFAKRGRWGHLPSIADRIDASGDCWEWDHPEELGYGITFAEGRRQAAHRVVWKALVGPIPEGMYLDHLCMNRGCVNPDHLEVVTAAENTRRAKGMAPHFQKRKTHCPKGHPYSGDNLYLRPDGKGRGCRSCINDR